MVSFEVSKQDARIIRQIAERALLVLRRAGANVDLMMVMMDLEAVHANGCPLRLRELLTADAFNFAHDIVGIYNCLDRTTGTLTRHFQPRFARAVTK